MQQCHPSTHCNFSPEKSFLEEHNFAMTTTTTTTTTTRTTTATRRKEQYSKLPLHPQPLITKLNLLVLKGEWGSGSLEKSLYNPHNTPLLSFCHSPLSTSDGPQVDSSLIREWEALKDMESKASDQEVEGLGLRFGFQVLGVGLWSFGF